MSYQEDSTVVKIYQLPQGLAKDFAKQLPECQDSSFFDIVYALAMSAVAIAAIVMALVVANWTKEKYWPRAQGVEGRRLFTPP